MAMRAAEALKASDKKDHLRVNVTRDTQGDTLKVTSIELLQISRFASSYAEIFCLPAYEELSLPSALGLSRIYFRRLPLTSGTSSPSAVARSI
jgi:hypothetical protein